MCEPTDWFKSVFSLHSSSLRIHEIGCLSQLTDLRPFSYYILFKKSSNLMLEPADWFEVAFLIDLRPFPYYIFFKKSKICCLSQLTDLKLFSHHILFEKSSNLMLQPADWFKAVFLLHSLWKIIQLDAWANWLIWDRFLITYMHSL